MHSITVTHPFCYAHRLMNHRGKCRYIHGHNGVAVVTVAATGALTEGGMVLDFADLKKIVCGWVDDNWDHNIILNHDDPLAKLSNVPSLIICSGRDDFTGPVKPVRAGDVFGDRAPYIMQGHPTAESMAYILFHTAGALLVCHPVRVLSATIHETEKCSATYHQEVRR